MPLCRCPRKEAGGIDGSYKCWTDRARSGRKRKQIPDSDERDRKYSQKSGEYSSESDPAAAGRDYRHGEKSRYGSGSGFWRKKDC